MIIEHENKVPQIHESVYIAPNATICGDVRIGRGTRILFGAQIISESNPITIGEDCIILENAVIRAAKADKVKIGNHCLIGPNTHIASCEIEDEVFIATGASVFHGSKIMKGAEIRINGVVHVRTIFPEKEVLPIGWIAVGNPMKMYPPKDHDEIWEKQKELNFPELVYGIQEKSSLNSTNKVLCNIMSERLNSHKEDKII